MTFLTCAVVCGLLASSALAWSPRTIGGARVIARMSLLVGAIVLAVSARDAVSGHGAVVDLGGVALLRFDLVGWSVCAIIIALGVVVQSYAHRLLDGAPTARAFHAGSSVVLAGAFTAASAARFSVLASGWILTSFGTMLLMATTSGTRVRTSTRRAARALVAGDVAVLVGALALVLHGVDGFSHVAPAHTWTALSIGQLHVSGPALVTTLFVLAALSRAGQVPFGPWVSATVNAPTPVSALLHAGVVNAGAVLLLRVTPWCTTWSVPMLLLLACVSVSIVLAVQVTARRGDIKGALAYSTVAQMGFMLLMISIGLPAVALTHLLGHALYKAHRFLASGDTTDVVARQRVIRSTTLVAPATAWGVAVLVGVLTSGGAILLAREWSLSATWSTFALLVVVASAVGVIRLASKSSPESWRTSTGALVVVVTGYLAASAWFDHVLATRLLTPHANALWAVVVVGVVLLAASLSPTRIDSWTMPRGPMIRRRDARRPHVRLSAAVVGAH